MRALADEPDPDLDARVAAAWLTLLDEADAIADSISLTLLEKDAEVYERAGPEFRVDVRGEHPRAHPARHRGDGRPRGRQPHDRQLWRETGRRRARQGIAMELVLNAYTLGTRFLWEALVAQREHGKVDDQVLLVAGQKVWSALDVQNAVFIDAYRRESVRLHRRDLQRQQSTLDALVEGRGTDPAFAAEAREVLGIGPEMAVACVVAPYDGSLDEPLTPPAERLGRHGITSHWHVRGGVSFGVLAGELPDDDELVALLTPHAIGRVGRGALARRGGRVRDGVHAGLAGPRTRCRARAARWSRSRSGCPRCCWPTAPRSPRCWCRRPSAPLLAQPPHVAEVLMQTLAALLDHNGSAKHAAEALFCHRNTVIYRARQIEELTGRRLADPRDKLLLAPGRAHPGLGDDDALLAPGAARPAARPGGWPRRRRPRRRR